MNLTLSDVDLLAVIRDCTRMLREQFTSAGLSLSEPATPKELAIRGDRSKLLQVLLNLVSNADKFTRRGGIISILVEATDSDVTVEVRDTGIGMTASEIETALTPFAQVDNRLERKYDGTGLGLPLAKSLVELHGGSLKVKSTPGMGTSVFVTLPRLADSDNRRGRKAVVSASA